MKIIVIMSKIWLMNKRQYYFLSMKTGAFENDEEFIEVQVHKTLSRISSVFFLNFFVIWKHLKVTQLFDWLNHYGLANHKVVLLSNLQNLCRERQTMFTGNV